MKLYLISLFFISIVNLVSCGFLTGHHPLPPNVISSRTVIGGASGGGPSSGAYSSSQLTQSISSSPTHVQSSIATYHPSQYSYNRGIGYNQGSGNNQGSSGFTQGQFSVNQGQSQGYGQGQGQNYNGYSTNNPNVIAYGYYGYGNQGYGNQGYGSQGQGQGQGGQNQNQGGYYQTQQYGYNSGQGQSGYGRF